MLDFDRQLSTPMVNPVERAIFGEGDLESPFSIFFGVIIHCFFVSNNFGCIIGTLAPTYVTVSGMSSRSVCHNNLGET